MRTRLNRATGFQLPVRRAGGPHQCEQFEPHNTQTSVQSGEQQRRVDSHSPLSLRVRHGSWLSAIITLSVQIFIQQQIRKEIALWRQYAEALAINVL
eukprot:1990165-Pleurochrysis_carterae.AAC.1